MLQCTLPCGYVCGCISHDFIPSIFQGRNEYIGRTEVKPVVRLRMDTPSPHLDWYPIHRYNKKAGDLLAAFELLLVSGPLVECVCVHAHARMHTCVCACVRACVHAS